MTAVYTVIRQLEATSSRLEKEAILHKLSTNEELKRFFYMALEPKLNFFVRKIPHYVLMGATITLNEAMTALGALSSRQVTGNSAIDHLKKILSSMTMEDAMMLERIINKDPKCNVSTSIANKVWPGLITDVPYMRCSLAKDSNIQKFNWKAGVYSQLKADGMFCTVDVLANGTCYYSSRNGSPLPPDMLQSITNQLVLSIDSGNQVHGELVIYKNGEILPRKLSNGIMNSVLHGGEFPAAHEPRFQVWDIIPISEAKPKNKYNVPYKTRYAILEKAFVGHTETSPVHLIETKIVHTYDDAMKHFKEVRKRKLEGTIIKDGETCIWEDTTSKNSVKMKAEVEVDLKIIGFNAGAKTSKHSELFGSIQLATSDDLLEVAATGFSDEERQDIHDRRDQLIGSIVTICSNELFEPSKTNTKYSLFLPRVVEFRKDKTIADTLQQVKDQFEAAIKD